jgi:hypothetical protein
MTIAYKISIDHNNQTSLVDIKNQNKTKEKHDKTSKIKTNLSIERLVGIVALAPRGDDDLAARLQHPRHLLNVSIERGFHLFVLSFVGLVVYW